MIQITLNILIIFALIQIGSTKIAKFISIEKCESKNEVVEVKKCEIDETGLTMHFDIKTPIVKIMLTQEVNFLNDNNQTVKTVKFQNIDWCQIFKNGKMPNDAFWKVAMKAYGRIFHKFMKCPLKGKMELNQISADLKSLQFLPSIKARGKFIGAVTGDNGKKDFFILNIIWQIFD